MNVGQLLAILKTTDVDAHVLLSGAADLPANVPAGPFALDKVSLERGGVHLITEHPSDQVGLIQTSSELLHALRQLVAESQAYPVPVFLAGTAGFGLLTQTTEMEVKGVRVLNLVAPDAVLHNTEKLAAAAGAGDHEPGTLTEGNATRIQGGALADHELDKIADGILNDPEAIEEEQKMVAGQVHLSPPANGVADELRHGYLLRVPHDQGDCTLVDAHPPVAGELRPARVVNREHVAELLAAGVLHKVEPTASVRNGAGSADFYV